MFRKYEKKHACRLRFSTIISRLFVLSVYIYVLFPTFSETFERVANILLRPSVDFAYMQNLQTMSHSVHVNGVLFEKKPLRQIGIFEVLYLNILFSYSNNYFAKDVSGVNSPSSVLQMLAAVEF